MSDAEYHPVAAGPAVARAWPLVDALLARSDPRAEMTAEVTVAGGSHAVSAYRTPPGATAAYELHVPAGHGAEHDAALGSLADAVDDGEGGCWLTVPDVNPAVLDALPEVPVEMTVTGIPRAVLRHDLVPTEADAERAGVRWSAWWPPVPELGLGPHLKHAAVQLFVNCTGLWDLEPGPPGFRLYVVTGERDHGRAAHLAAAAGLTVTGAPEHY